ncbi:hypothetical protein LguiA_022339 [Lonicera macranthoides]
MSDYVLPTEIWIEEILTRLPVKTLLRCTSVCKSWYSLITSPNFITLHLNRTASNNDNRLLIRSCNNRIENYSVYTDNETFDECEKLHFPLHSRINRFNIVGNCNGLVCLSEDVQQYTDIMILWNPSIRKFVHLPYPNFGYNTHGAYLQSVGFGFNPVTNDYNVVRIAYLKKVETEVVELYELSTGSWRNVCASVDISYVIKSRSTQVVLNGVVHWVGLARKDGHAVIVSFDFKSETFGVMRVPHRAEAELNMRLCVTVFGESLSLIDERIYMNETYCNIWVMKEYGMENTWTRQLKIDTTPVPHLRRSFDCLRVLYGFRNNGDVLLAENSDSEDLVSYDPKSRNFKKLGIRGCGMSFYISTYMESLVLINGKSDALEM